MKATLSFDLTDGSEALSHRRALNGTNAYIALFSIMNDVFRKRIKYGELDFDSENLLVEMQQEISTILQDYGIDLNDLE